MPFSLNVSQGPLTYCFRHTYRHFGSADKLLFDVTFDIFIIYFKCATQILNSSQSFQSPETSRHPVTYKVEFFVIKVNTSNGYPV